ncbi:hypothetical protein AB0L06_20715 [Spirillospora sp. NPDC052269]
MRKVLDRQARAVEFLDGHLQRDLPPLRWEIQSDGDLYGWIEGCANGRQLRAFLKPWAEHLGVPLDMERDLSEVVAEIRPGGHGPLVLCKGWVSWRWPGFGRPRWRDAPPKPGLEAAQMRGEQRRAATALRELLQEDLPALEWEISNMLDEGPEYLRGRVPAFAIKAAAGDERAAAVIRDTMETWGRFLGSDLVEEPTAVRVRAEWKQVPVVVELVGSWSFWKAEPPATGGGLWKVVEEE